MAGVGDRLDDEFAVDSSHRPREVKAIIATSIQYREHDRRTPAQQPFQDRQVLAADESVRERGFGHNEHLNTTARAPSSRRR